MPTLLDSLDVRNIQYDREVTYVLPERNAVDDEGIFGYGIHVDGTLSVNKVIDCKEVKLQKKESFPRATGNSSAHYSMRMVKDEKSLMRSFSIGLQGSAQGLPLFALPIAKFGIFEEDDFSTRKINIIVTMTSMKAKTKTLTNMDELKVKRTYGTLLVDHEKVTKEFTQKCGHHFPYIVRRGAAFVGVITISLSNESHVREMSAELGGNLNWATLSAKLKFAKKKYRNSLSITATYKMLGITAPGLQDPTGTYSDGDTTIKELQKLSVNFFKRAEESDCYLPFITATSWEALGLRYDIQENSERLQYDVKEKIESEQYEEAAQKFSGITSKEDRTRLVSQLDGWSLFPFAFAVGAMAKQKRKKTELLDSFHMVVSAVARGESVYIRSQDDGFVCPSRKYPLFRTDKYIGVVPVGDHKAQKGEWEIKHKGGRYISLYDNQTKSYLRKTETQGTRASTDKSNASELEADVTSFRKGRKEGVYVKFTDRSGLTLFESKEKYGTVNKKRKLRFGKNPAEDVSKFKLVV